MVTKPQTRTALEVGVHALLASEAWWQQAGCAGFGQGGILGECSRGTGQCLPLDGQATLHNRCLLRAHSTCVGILPNETEHQAAVPCWRRRVGWHPADRNAAQGGWNQSALRKISGGGAQIIFELRCVLSTPESGDQGLSSRSSGNACGGGADHQEQDGQAQAPRSLRLRNCFQKNMERDGTRSSISSAWPCRVHTAGEAVQSQSCK